MGQICRGGSLTSHPRYCYLQGRLVIEPPLQMPAYKYLRFVGAAQSPAAPTNNPHIKQTTAHSFSSGHSLQPVKERWGGLGHLPKIALLRGEGFGLKSFGGEVVEGKKILFHTFFEVLMVG